MKTRTRAKRAGGFTLIELLVASALLAVLAVIGWRGLDAVLSARDRIVERSDALQALSVTFSQLDEDLRRSWPVRLLGLSLPTLAFRGSGATPTMELLREGGGASDPSRIERVAYRLRDGLFERGFGPLLATQAAASSLGGADGSLGGTGSGGLADPTASSGALPVSNAPLIWQPLLNDVVLVRYRGWVAQRGWIDAATLAAMQASQVSQAAQAAAIGATAGASGAGTAAGAAAAAASAVAAAQQVTGVEVEIVRGNGERYLRVFPVQD